MIALTRAMARQFRLMARRGLSTGRPRGPAPPVRITAADNSITLTAHLGDVVVAWTQPAPQAGGAGSLTLPMSAFEKFEGSGSEIVALEANSAERGQARWSIGDAPCTTEFELVETPLVWPIVPEELFTLPPTFLTAMHEAGRTAAREEGKYAFDGVQIRGKAGQLIATDGKQALIQGGFKFPFAEDLIVPAVPFFGAKELAGTESVNIDRIDNWLFVEIGLWHIWLQIDPEKRFPDVVGAIPRATGTHLKIHDEDAQKVLEVLPQLPRVTGDDVQSVTLDLGRSVAIRVPGGIEREIVEVPLRQSESNGPSVQVVLNRAHLGRALALGFREFRCASPERPMVAMDGPRMYLSAALDPSLAVPSAKSAPRKTSGAITDRRSEIPNRPPIDSTHYSRTTAMPARESPSPERNGHAEANGESLGDPLVEAEALRTTLTEAQAQAGRLIAALKGFRKQHKTVSSALASLRSLRLE